MSESVDKSRSTSGRSPIDHHAVRAVGDLLMLGAWVERRARGVSNSLSTRHRGTGLGDGEA